MKDMPSCPIVPSLCLLLQELGSEARQCCCLHYIDTLFDEEYCCGRRTRNVATWVLEALDKAAGLFKDSCV